MQGPVPLDLAFMGNENGVDIGPEGYVGRPAKMTTGQLEDLPVEVGRAKTLGAYRGSEAWSGSCSLAGFSVSSSGGRPPLATLPI
jgi:hypothetical protein